MKARWQVIVGGVAAAAALSFAAVAVAGGESHPETQRTSSPSDPGDSRVITVTGSGTVFVEPDTAIVRLGARAEAATGEEAMSEINASSQGLTEALVDAGVAEEDIQTSRINLRTKTDNRGEVTGYEASLSVSVTIRDIAAVGATIDAAQQGAGSGFTISGVSFTLADPEAALEQARLAAGADARRRAEQYAEGVGFSLGYVVSVTEYSSAEPIRVTSDAEMAMAMDDAGPSISPGQLDIYVEISVTFAIAS